MTVADITKQFEVFTPKQIEAIKQIIKDEFWGDCDMEFGDKKTSYAYGYCTNLKKGKQHSGVMSGISKVIKAKKLNFITMISDWWQDGSGDMMFINLDVLDKDALEQWAAQ